MLAHVDQSQADAAESRGAAQRALEEALRTRDLGIIAEALAGARNAGLVSAETRMAEGLLEPAQIVRDGLSCEDLDELLPKELRGLSEEEAVVAERAACARLNKEELQARVVELSRYLALSRLHARPRLEQALLTRLEAADAASLRDLGEALARADAAHDEATARELAELEVELQQQHEEAVAAATVAAMAEAERAVAAEDEKLREAAEAALQQVRQMNAYNSLSVAVLGLEDAITTGRSALPELEALRVAAGKADAYVEQLLVQLPESCAELCKRAAAVPTEPLLRQRLVSQLDDLAAVAFTPPGGGLLGEVLGRVFRWCYVLTPDAVPLPAPGGAPQEVERNLTALSCAALSCAARETPGEVDALELETALACLEGSLGGRCRERAAAWMAELRSALILRQTLWAVKAHVQYLHAASP